jgi:hypothetical protein
MLVIFFSGLLLAIGRNGRRTVKFPSRVSLGMIDVARQIHRGRLARDRAVPSNTSLKLERDFIVARANLEAGASSRSRLLLD